jgi:hypothetical protein
MVVVCCCKHWGPLGNLSSVNMLGELLSVQVGLLFFHACCTLCRVEAEAVMTETALLRSHG